MRAARSMRLRGTWKRKTVASTCGWSWGRARRRSSSERTSPSARPAQHGRGGYTDIGGVPWQRPHHRAPRAKYSTRSDRDARDHDRAGAQLRTFLDAHVPTEVRVGMERHKVLQHVVVRNLAVHVDGHEATYRAVDGDDRTGGDIAAFADPAVWPDRGRRVHDRGPGQSERCNAFDDRRLERRQTHAEHERGVVAMHVGG